MPENRKSLENSINELSNYNDIFLLSDRPEEWYFDENVCQRFDLAESNLEERARRAVEFLSKSLTIVESTPEIPSELAFSLHAKNAAAVRILREWSRKKDFSSNNPELEDERRRYKIVYSDSVKRLVSIYEEQKKSANAEVYERMIGQLEIVLYSIDKAKFDSTEILELEDSLYTNLSECRKLAPVEKLRHLMCKLTQSEFHLTEVDDVFLTIGSEISLGEKLENINRVREHLLPLSHLTQSILDMVSSDMEDLERINSNPKYFRIFLATFIYMFADVLRYISPEPGLEDEELESDMRVARDDIDSYRTSNRLLRIFWLEKLFTYASYLAIEVEDDKDELILDYTADTLAKIINLPGVAEDSEIAFFSSFLLLNIINEKLEDTEGLDEASDQEKAWTIFMAQKDRFQEKLSRFNKRKIH